MVAPAALAAAIDPGHRARLDHVGEQRDRHSPPIGELAPLAHERGVPFHTDAAQAVGKIPLEYRALGADLLTLVGHKMYAPKGIGALYVRAGPRLEPVVYGGGQEHGLRSGTENLAPRRRPWHRRPTWPAPISPPTGRAARSGTRATGCTISSSNSSTGSVCA